TNATKKHAARLLVSSSVVLDASAALAFILNEPGGSRVMALLLDVDSLVAMSAVNWCETLTRLQRNSSIVDSEKLASMLPGVEVVPFGRDQAEFASELASRSNALSLGDRACVALASMRKAKAWTTDKIWARTKLPI